MVVTSANMLPPKESVNFEFGIDLEGLSTDEEIYMFQCPDMLHQGALLGKTLNVQQFNKFSHSAENNDIQVNVVKKEKGKICIAFPTNSGASLLSVPLSGQIFLQRVLNLPAVSECKELEIGVEKKVIHQIRHPLLGINWKKYVDSANQAMMQTVMDREEKPEKNSKKQKRTITVPEMSYKKKKRKS